VPPAVTVSVRESAPQESPTISRVASAATVCDQLYGVVTVVKPLEPGPTASKVAGTAPLPYRLKRYASVTRDAPPRRITGGTGGTVTAGGPVSASAQSGSPALLLPLEV
jgi:hypothetical protein